MKRLRILAVSLFMVASYSPGQQLGYHEIRMDSQGKLVPWSSPIPADAYDHVVGLVWKFWNGMGNCTNGLPYFFQHQVWKPEHDPRGLGGDQLAMALSSLNLLYQYSGDPAVRQMMIRAADYYLERGFSRANDSWPNLPYPYNTDLHSGHYDGDMRAGKGYLQPDKAGSLAAELLTLFEMTDHRRYLTAAIKIADTLAAKVTPGDADHSPWPFRVHARTGEIATKASAAYTANWTGTLRLFSELNRLGQGNTAAYSQAFQIASQWLKRYPLKDNRWGPFFEDVTEWSNTEINADTMACYLLEHPEWDPASARLARGILDWSLETFGTNGWAGLGVTAILEQTAYRMPGNSHTSRHASVELLYCETTGDTKLKDAAIRQLNWATYMVDSDGKNRYPNDDIWLTDGYGDYLRHYLRAMAAAPELAPADKSHLLRSSSVIQQIDYRPGAIQYKTYDATSQERFRINFQPANVSINERPVRRINRREDLKGIGDGYYFEEDGDQKGLLDVQHSAGTEVNIRAAYPSAGATSK